ncbi:hypothetical protein [Methylobacterium oryzihabitans]|uniref:ParB/Sulfiredoxin domain-containing protein n=1 Tax=Methylobacterium oryzihabitans TaxID=2499852 RepID=A0A437P874_9HYPH|nr:hypothetical protein [Methylobacterium oryzihabitans]RVU18495.1 hypothetical protein EOE48_11480 [Methylobacterium oryzihabitans]
MTTTFTDLGAPVSVAFESIYLDPNNPRIAPEPAPGYGDPEQIFGDDLQADLAEKVYDIYKAADLEGSVIRQGWTPVDPIVVWEHPDQKGAYIVVEGNTRISVLRRVRARREKEKLKLDRMKKGGKYPDEEISEQRNLLGQIDALIASTAKLGVYPVMAASVDELKAALPRLLGVRHILPARHWTPYATNLYIVSLYKTAFKAKHGASAKLALEDDVLDTVTEQLPLKRDEIRKSIQAASAFGHFKRMYEEKVEEAGNTFNDGDQYFFDNILASKHARDQFGFGPKELNISDEGEAALFAWAFAKKRQAGGDDYDSPNENVFQKAEDIRVWQSLARYDKQNGTKFADRLDVSNPEDAIPLWQIRRQKDDHKEKKTPVRTLESLLSALKELKADSLLAQSAILEPMLDEIAQQVSGYLDMMKGASSHTAAAE